MRLWTKKISGQYQTHLIIKISIYWVLLMCLALFQVLTYISHAFPVYLLWDVYYHYPSFTFEKAKAPRDWIHRANEAQSQDLNSAVWLQSSMQALQTLRYSLCAGPRIDAESDIQGTPSKGGPEHAHFPHVHGHYQQHAGQWLLFPETLWSSFPRLQTCQPPVRSLPRQSHLPKAWCRSRQPSVQNHWDKVQSS